MNICESHQLGVSCDTEDAEGSRGVSGGPAQGGDVGATMETQCPVEDPSAVIDCYRVSAQSNGSHRAQFVPLLSGSLARRTRRADAAPERLGLRAKQVRQMASPARWSHGPVR